MFIICVAWLQLVFGCENPSAEKKNGAKRPKRREAAVAGETVTPS